MGQPYFVLPKLAPVAAAQPNAGYSIAHYEPEYLKYGGEVGLAIAEKLFEVSSEIALETIVSDWQSQPAQLQEQTLARLVVWSASG